MSKQYTNFREFWPFYVQEHQHPLNRRLHFLGTALALGCLASATVRRKPPLLALAPVAGYFFAWLGHFVVEKNRPATFQYPLMSLRGDFKMFGLMATGRMNEEVQKVLLEAEAEMPTAGVTDSGEEAPEAEGLYELGQTLEPDAAEDEVLAAGLEEVEEDV